MASAETRLAVYGTLAPGQPNQHMLAPLNGTWRTGTVRGTLHASGWGAALGFPGLVLDSDGPVVNVQIFESVDLPGHWAELDTFEDGYDRVPVTVTTDDGPIEASIYVLQSS